MKRFLKYDTEDAKNGVGPVDKNGIIKKEHDGVKILGNGKLSKKLIVKASAFSESAKQKIEEAGGKAEVI